MRFDDIMLQYIDITVQAISNVKATSSNYTDKDFNKPASLYP